MVPNVIYLLYDEGYSATAGTEWMRPTLCQEALLPGGSSARWFQERARCMACPHLLEVQSSRLAARTTEDGSPILLLDQDSVAMGPGARR
jgi:predicted RNA polymerase sigma factor